MKQWRGDGHRQFTIPGNRELRPRRTHRHDRPQFILRGVRSPIRGRTTTHPLTRSPYKLRDAPDCRASHSASSPATMPAPAATCIFTPLFCRGRRQPRRRRPRRNLTATLSEKDVTVALARSLRQELESRGIPTLVLRDSDANCLSDQRATFTNADHAAIYIAAPCSFKRPWVHVYTALLPYGAEDHGTFRDWSNRPDTRHSRSAKPLPPRSPANYKSGKFRFASWDRSLRPLNNVIGAAIAVEVAPRGCGLIRNSPRPTISNS